MTGDVLRVGMLPVTMLGGCPQQSYSDKVMSYGPIAYWPLWETAGATAVDLVNSPVQDGTYTGVTLANGTAPDGSPCPFFDGANDFVNIYSLTFSGAFGSAEGSCFLWHRAANAGVWTDGNPRLAIRVAADNNNQIQLSKSGVNNIASAFYETQNIRKNRDVATSTTDWFHMGLTWSQTANETRVYFNGIQEGATMVAAPAWVGALSALLVIIGAFTLVPAFAWHGWLSHCAIWNSALSPAAILDLATV